MFSMSKNFKETIRTYVDKCLTPYWAMIGTTLNGSDSYTRDLIDAINNGKDSLDKMGVLSIPEGSDNTYIHVVKGSGSGTPYVYEYQKPNDVLSNIKGAPLDSPNFTGVPSYKQSTYLSTGTDSTIVTFGNLSALHDTISGETEQAISKIPKVKPSSNTPLMDGNATPGSSADVSAWDHVHPTDTSRAYKNGNTSEQFSASTFLGSYLTNPSNTNPNSDTSHIVLTYLTSGSTTTNRLWINGSVVTTGQLIANGGIATNSFSSSGNVTLWDKVVMGGGNASSLLIRSSEIIIDNKAVGTHASGKLGVYVPTRLCGNITLRGASTSSYTGSDSNIQDFDYPTATGDDGTFRSYIPVEIYSTLKVSTSDAKTTVLNIDASAMKVAVTTTFAKKVTFSGGTSGANGDNAELYHADDTYQPGQVIMPSYDTDNTVTLCTDPYNALGVYSTKPQNIINDFRSTADINNNVFNKCVPLALTGIVPVLVNGPVHRGKPIVAIPNGTCVEKPSGDDRPHIGRSSVEDLNEGLRLVLCYVSIII